MPGLRLNRWWRVPSGAVPEPPPMDQVNLLDLGLSSTDIDARLIYLAGIGTTQQTINIQGNQPRTAASNAAVTQLTTTLENHLLEDYFTD